jgi:acetyl-CoA C-acetyltransferase
MSDIVLVGGIEKMTDVSGDGATYALATAADQEYEVYNGATFPGLYALMARAYMEKFGATRHQLSAVPVKNHENGLNNPNAQYQMKISINDVNNSVMVADPLRILDCSPITDGAAAVILTGEKTDVRLSGVGQATGPISLQERESFTSFTATKIAAARAYAMAQLGPQDIDFAEVHDAFTPFEIISTEDLGFFPPGKGGEAAMDGKTGIDGALPINPSGGLKARGHPVGASGLAQVVEVTKGLRGQLPLKSAPKRGLTQSTGGLGANNIVTILERADAPVGQNRWAPSPTTPGETKGKSSAAQIADEGVIETFTILYVTPDGFLPPLALALIRDRHGTLLMAQGEDDTQLKIGREVYLRRVGGVDLFTVKSQIEKVQEAFMKLFRRSTASPTSNSDRSGDQK